MPEDYWQNANRAIERIAKISVITIINKLFGYVYLGSFRGNTIERIYCLI